MSVRYFNGTLTQYKNLHRKINRIYGSPKRCDNCGIEDYPKFEWSNIDNNYQIIREAWQRLCVPCHRKYD